MSKAITGKLLFRRKELVAQQSVQLSLTVKMDCTNTSRHETGILEKR